jgi:heat shock protein HtpX
MIRNTGLRTRVLVTIALVLAIDVLFVAVLAALLDPWLVALTDGLVDAMGVTHPSPALRWSIVLGVALVAFVAAQLAYARHQTLVDADAHVVRDEEYPTLVARVERLSQQAGHRPPTVAVAESPVPNSFTVGGVRNATIVVSTGLLETLDDDELDAVLAHELAHVLNRDVRVMTLASFLPSVVDGDVSMPGGTAGKVVVAIAATGLYLANMPRLGFEPTGSTAVVALLALPVTLLVASVALGVLATPVLYLARRLSRYREFAADRAGAVISGDPSALASALGKLDDVTGAPATDKREVYDGVRRLCLLPHGFSNRDERDEAAFSVEVRSHPPTEDRIDRLADVAAAMERTE